MLFIALLPALFQGIGKTKILGNRCVYRIPTLCQPWREALTCSSHWIELESSTWQEMPDRTNDIYMQIAILLSLSASKMRLNAYLRRVTFTFLRISTSFSTLPEGTIWRFA
uniref:Uncharacterized protein n=1 Tax=Candidatus Kentrum sp. TUN TaxID=2126343 RepID=A0A451AIJ7_9GAMM|nr:MAG: hypothetical protein BECKTUN1418F_GA0071002_11198 [Candidatus Kentron sp. TUN]VFK65883.1 MAG: hypothetical protein BECKTUN1418E_GA0071001_11158 [Candidatus Kentron sp. TUN]